MNPIGTCRLCLNERELRDSHLVPKAAYKRLLGGDGKNRNPFFVNEDRALTNIRTDNWLCLMCGL